MDGKLVNQSPSIGDVAREAGVSKATVSNWLNGKSTRLSPETRQRLTEVADRLGYRPMLGARRLSSRTPSGTVGLVVRRNLAGVFADPFVARVMEGVARVFATSHTRGLLVTSPMAPGEDTEYLLSLARGIVDGFLVFDIEGHDRTLEALVRHDVPFVAVGQPEGPVAFPWVATNHAGAVAEAVAWLAARGHRAIAFETNNPDLLVDRHRRRGYVAALHDRGLEPDPSLPTAVLRTLEIHRAHPAPSGAEVVLTNAYPGLGPATGAWIEAPSALIGERAALLLEERLLGRRPAPELHPAVFHAAPTHP